MKISILIIAITFLLPFKVGMASATIEIRVEHIYADGSKAVIEQIWEEGWSWTIQSNDGFRIDKSSATKARIKSKNKNINGETIIVFSNKYEQSHKLSIPITIANDTNKRESKQKLDKYYNKLVLNNMADTKVIVNVYFGNSGIKDVNEIEDNEAIRKCPPAKGGGYSFPVISLERKKEYSIYLKLNDIEFKELRFDEYGWYGSPSIQSIDIQQIFKN